MFKLVFSELGISRCLLILLIVTPKAWALTDEELEYVRDGFGDRRDAYLTDYLDNPLYEIDDGYQTCRVGLASANWIWYPGEEATRQAESGTRYFRHAFTIPNDSTILRAYAAFAIDNYGSLSVNGSDGRYLGGFHQATPHVITQSIKPGTNEIVITAHNGGAVSNPAGLIGTIYIELDSAPAITLTTNDSWDAAKEPDGEWQPAEALGPADTSPWGAPHLGLETEVNRYVFTRLTFALAAMHLDVSIDDANTAIIEAVDLIRAEHQFASEFGLHWMGGAFYRIYGLFGPDGILKEDLSTEASNAIWQLFADWARTESRIAESDPDLTWHLWGSENHSAQRDATRWAAARMIASDPRGESYRYEDGSTAAEQLAAWRIFMKRYYRERIKRGMLIEISPSGYGSRTMQGWHNIYDFTDDPELKHLAKSALDVWWAAWAQEQLNGMRGGGKTRLYPGAYGLSGSDRNRAMSWFYLGQGKPAHQHETLPVIATTTYRLPLVVMDIALDPEGRGVYEVKSRRLGRLLPGTKPNIVDKRGNPIYDVDPEYGALVRYSYCTPEFVIGSLMLENQPADYWSKISAQNRWHGVIFDGDLDSTIYPRCDTNRSTSNAHWAVQNKGTLIAQKLRGSVTTKDMRVCFSTDLERHEEGGWILADAKGAFAAVKIVDGDWEWVDKRWLRCEKEFTPVILEVVRKADYNGDFEAFKADVLAQDIHYEDEVLRYKGLRQQAGEFTFYAGSDQLPEINGKAIDLRPAHTFQSPFLVEEWASGIVRINKGNRELRIDVRE